MIAPFIAEQLLAYNTSCRPTICSRKQALLISALAWCAVSLAYAWSATAGSCCRFFFTELMGWRGSISKRPPLFRHLPPSLYRAKVQLHHGARWTEPRADGNRFVRHAQHIAAT
jgi:hypothetical protein